VDYYDTLISPPGRQPPADFSYQLLANAAIGLGLFRSFSVFYANVEQSRLCCRMSAQFGHLIHTAFHRLLLLSFDPALCLVLLSLLPGVFLLAFCKR
jgi:hypothetical protein